MCGLDIFSLVNFITIVFFSMATFLISGRFGGCRLMDPASNVPNIDAAHQYRAEFVTSNTAIQWSQTLIIMAEKGTLVVKNLRG